MGFFSWNCKGCGVSIKAPYDLCKSKRWMNVCVLLEKGWSGYVSGHYDGYGRIEDEVQHEIQEYRDPELWHKKCWEIAGKPEYSGPSDNAQDQGFFDGE